MGFFLPDPRFEMPGLFEPGRKPIERVEIDWTNPFAKNLVHCYLFSDTQQLEDLVSGNNAVPFNGPLFDVYNRERGWDFDGSNDRMECGVSPQTSKLTFALKMLTVGGTAAQWDRIIQRGNTDTYGFALVPYNTTTREFLFTDWLSSSDYSIETTTGIFDSMPLPSIVMVTSPRSGTVTDGRIYVNGVQHNTIQTALGEVAFSGTGSDLFIARRAHTNTQWWDGAIGFVMVWDRVFSAAEAKGFNLNPYQFLIPV